VRALALHVDDVLREIAGARHLALLTDFDGTLVPFAERPELATLPRDARDLLASLSALPGVTLGIVSGRALDDVSGKICLPGIWVVGNHGFEIQAPGGQRYELFERSELSLLADLEADLRRRAAAIPGAWVEPKGPILAFHFRGAREEERDPAERAFLEAVSPRRRRLMVVRGSCVLEARLRGTCNKGTAVRRIAGTLPRGSFLLYAGDDITDQDAFRAVRGRGNSISVGVPSDLADYHAPGPGAWLDFLGRLFLHLQGRATAPRGMRRPRSPE
jgi:trehalose-phosphatase